MFACLRRSAAMAHGISSGRGYERGDDVAFLVDVSTNRQENPMTLKDDIDAIKSRIAKAESERDAWRLAGLEEKYIEAYSMVEALELQLEQRLRQPSY